MKIPIRSMIVAPKDHLLVQCDLSQAESWVVAFLANERNMKRALMYGDIHTQTAGSALFYSDVGCPHDWDKDTRTCKLCSRVVDKTGRYVGKRYNHASAYRMKAERAAQVINKDSDKPPFFTVTVKESKKFSEAWHNYYNLKVWWGEIEEKLRQTRSLTTTYGRSRVFFAQWGDELFKEATAYEPQSTVADHFNGKLHPVLRVPGGLKRIYHELVKPYPDRRIINQSHDSAIVVAPKGDALELAAQMKSYIQRPMLINNEEFTIPADAEIGERWGELEGVK